VPITVLGQVTHLSPVALGAMVGRQLPLVALILPFYVMAIYGGMRSVRALWPMLLVAGGAFALTQFVSANLIDYQLTDVLSSLVSLLVTVAFLKVWRPAADPEFAIVQPASLILATSPSGRRVAPSAGWIPWLVVAAVVIVWTHFKIFATGADAIPWPGLDKAVSITLYDNRPYAAVWAFQPLATGTAILLSAIITALLVGLQPGAFFDCVGRTWRQTRIAILTVMLIVGLAYLMNYSGLSYTLGLGVSKVGAIFPLVSPFLGWIAVFLSGSDTSGNALFGNLQVVAANQLQLNPVLIAASNSSGGVMGKMISPQNISTGVSTVGMQGQEGRVFARTFGHSIVLTLLVGIIVVLEQYVVPGIIPK